MLASGALYDPMLHGTLFHGRDLIGPNQRTERCLADAELPLRAPAGAGRNQAGKPHARAVAGDPEYHFEYFAQGQLRRRLRSGAGGGGPGHVYRAAYRGADGRVEAADTVAAASGGRGAEKAG